MILFTFLKWFDKSQSRNTGVLWCGAGFSFLVDVFVIVVLSYWLNVAAKW